MGKIKNLWLQVTLAVAALCLSTEVYAQTISESGSSGGGLYVNMFANPIGQVITPPSNLPLTTFSLYLNQFNSADGTVTPQVAEWNGTFPAGSQGTVVWTGAPVTITDPIGGFVAFPTGGIPIDPTKQYVVQVLNPTTTSVRVSYSGSSGYSGGGIVVGTSGQASDLLFSATFAATTSVTGLSPATGQAGASVTITGTQLTGATAVMFGATAATSFTVISATQINAVAPAGNGTVDVKVVTPGGSNPNTAADNFTYVVPVPTMSEWAMILFGMILAGGTVRYIQRRHQFTA